MSSTTMKTYDSSQVSVSIGGIPILDFEEISFEPNENTWEMTTGSSGEGTRTKNSSTMTTVMIGVTQTSDASPLLSVAHDTDGLLQILVMDHNGTSLLSIPNGSIMKKAKKTFNKTQASGVEWEVQGPSALNVVGGNF